MLRACPFCTRSVMFPCPPSTVFLAALQMRCKNSDTLLLGTPGILCAWALQGYFSVGHCRDTLRLGTSVKHWALQGYLVVGHCRDTWWLGSAGILGGYSLQSASSRARTTSTLKSNNATARVGNNFDNLLSAYSYPETFNPKPFTLKRVEVICGGPYPQIRRMVAALPLAPPLLGAGPRNS